MRTDYPDWEQMKAMSEDELGHELAQQTGELVIAVHDALVNRGWSSTYAAKAIAVIGAGLLRGQGYDHELHDISDIVADMMQHVELPEGATVHTAPECYQ